METQEILDRVAWGLVGLDHNLAWELLAAGGLSAVLPDLTDRQRVLAAVVVAVGEGDYATISTIEELYAGKEIGAVVSAAWHVVESVASEDVHDDTSWTVQMLAVFQDALDAAPRACGPPRCPLCPWHDHHTCVMPLAYESFRLRRISLS